MLGCGRPIGYSGPSGELTNSSNSCSLDKLDISYLANMQRSYKVCGSVQSEPSNSRKNAMAVLASRSKTERGFTRPSPNPENDFTSLGLKPKAGWGWTPNKDGSSRWSGLGGVKENLELLGYSVGPPTCLKHS